MDNLLSIVMYHYVRDLDHSRFPDIKGLTTELFKEQIGYIKKYYNVISGSHLLSIITSQGKLPHRALLLTFDDGYIDHFTQVFPFLYNEGLSACFFPSAKCICDHTVLDVHKIHFILASVSNKRDLVANILNIVTDFQNEFGLQDSQSYWDNFSEDCRYDSREVLFIKRMLQRDLPEQLRTFIISSLFKKYVTSDESAFSNELYMSIDQLRCLHRQGMYIGNHGYNHCGLNQLDRNSQEQEIDQSLAFLQQITNEQIDNWIICYPYGAFNDSLLEVLSSRGCKVGFTTEVGLADLNRYNPLTLPRLNTNDLPKDRNAEPSNWTTNH